MIDEETGNITIHSANIAIGPSLTRDAFLASSLGRNAQVNVENEPHCSYNAHIAAGDLMPLPAVLTLYFYHQKLESLSIVASDDRFGASWDDWSEEKEISRKLFHDQWLAAMAISTGAYLPWGQLSSNYDAKSGFSSIQLRYSLQCKL